MVTKKSKYDILYYTALICAVWFLFTSWFWTYYGNVIGSFPFGLLSLILWNTGRKRDENKARYKKIAFLLIAGVVASLISLAVFWAAN